MVEGGPELIHLLLGDALRVSRQDLGLHLVDGSGDGRQQHLPPDADVLPEDKEVVSSGSSQPINLALLVFLTWGLTQRDRSRAHLTLLLFIFLSF